MSYTISAYTKDVFQEYPLPSYDNADYTITFESKRFDIPNDITLKLEVVNGKWRILPSSHYTVRVAGMNLFEYDFEGSATVVLLVAGGSISLVIREISDVIRKSARYSIADTNRITIGKDSSCTIRYREQDLISGVHADIVKSGDKFILRDHSEQGTYHNGIRLRDPIELQFGDIIRVFGLTIIFFDGMLTVQSQLDYKATENVSLRKIVPEKYRTFLQVKENRLSDDTAKHYHRSPRSIIKLHSEPVTIEPPPEKKEAEKKPLYMTIGPAFTMAIPMLLGSSFMIYSRSTSGSGATGAFMYVGMITAITSTIIGVIWALLNIRYSAKKEREDELLRFEAYGDYLFEISNEIKGMYEHNQSALRQLYPSAEICAKYTAKSNCLWSRNKSHDDFLFHRIGVGNIPFQVPINVTKQKINIKSDALALKPKLISDSFKELIDVPIGIDLAQKRLIGIVGDDHSQAIEVMRSLAVQIAANNCYNEVKMAFVYNSETNGGESWDFARWLPHTWTDNHEIRFVASNDREKSDVFYELTKILRERAEREGQGSPSPALPHFVIFLASSDLIDNELISKYLLDPQPKYGVSTVILATSVTELPNDCKYVISNTSAGPLLINANDSSEISPVFTLDRVSAQEVDRFARNLCGVSIAEVEANGNIPSSLEFLEMLHVSSLEELDVMGRWRKNRTFDSLRACVGRKAGGIDCYIDIHEKHHGPHGLVAGTTGSGKSETLQTYILSLAINYSPYDVGFFIIDYKGGGMANLFAGLPHLIGQISNLSGNQVRRAMVSIKSENKRRQRIFTEYGVNHINAYTKLFKSNEAKEPIPHLFIIIDEFAELKREEPDFMRELISVAQVGRSLGVHLILSTQKPSGTVDDNIWSNAKMRLCLRVQDRQDSMDMLHKPDASTITNAGRCYLQVGNDELFELFQSGWSGATFEAASSGSKSNLATMVDITGHPALVGNKVKKKLKEKARIDWLSALVDCVLLATSSSGISISDAKADPSALNSLAKKTIDTAEIYKLDYPMSDYNLRRVEDLLTLFPEDAEMSEREDFVQDIIIRAKESDKKIPEQKEKTQLEATVEYLAEVASKNTYDQKMDLWMPVLPEKLYLDRISNPDISFDGEKWKIDRSSVSLIPYLGLIDDPVNQAQFPLVFDFIQGGHCAVCGTVSSGKSTFLQTMIYSLINNYSPEKINLFIADYSSKSLICFADAPQVGGIVTDDDVDRVEKLFNMLIMELNNRKKLIQGGSYSQYIAIEGNVLPAIMLVIDGYANFREKTEDMFEDKLIRLSREGIGYGIFLIISSGGFGSSEIQHRIGDNIRTTVCLEMGDKFKYAEVLRTMQIEVLPEANIKGRGLTVYDGAVLEFQTALSVETLDDYSRMEAIKNKCMLMKGAWKGRPAQTIPFIPEKPIWSDICSVSEFCMLSEDPACLPFAYVKETAAIHSVDLSHTYCYSIIGKPKSGKNDCITNLIRSAAMKNGRIVVIDTEAGRLKSVANEVKAEYLVTVQELFKFWLEMATTVLPPRNNVKKQLLEEGLSDSEVYLKQSQYQPVFIFIADFCAFTDTIYNPGKDVGAMSGCLENLIEKGAMNNVYVFGCINSDEMSRLSIRKMYSDFVSAQNGIVLGGNLSSQRLFTFTNISYSDQTRPLKPGNGYVPNPDDSSEGFRVVLPHSRR